MFKSSSPQETKKLAILLAQEIRAKKPKIKTALVIGLVGDLGSGKTEFVKSFAKQFGIRKKMTSPTFVLIRRYSLNNSRDFNNLFHIDTYRIEKPTELKKIGLEKIIKEEKNIILIEWADKIKKMLPKKMLWLYFYHGENEKIRIIKVAKK